MAGAIAEAILSGNAASVFDIWVIMSELSATEFRVQREAARPNLRRLGDGECWILVDQGGADSGRPKTDGRNNGLVAPGARTAHATEPPRQGQSSEKSTRIAIRSKGGILLLDPCQLTAIEAQGNYVLLKEQACSHLLRGSISTMAAKLEPYGFVRIHRSVLVNRLHVENVRVMLTGEYALHLKSGKTYTVTRRYKQNLRLLAELWIGASP